MFMKAIRWGWECNARWGGIGKSFTLNIPTNKDVVIQGMRYNPTFKTIEAWGYIKEDNNIGTQYKNDLLNPERSFSTCGQQSDGGADGTPQPNQPKKQTK